MEETLSISLVQTNVLKHIDFFCNNIQRDNLILYTLTHTAYSTHCAKRSMKDLFIRSKALAMIHELHYQVQIKERIVVKLQAKDDRKHEWIISKSLKRVKYVAFMLCAEHISLLFMIKKAKPEPQLLNPMDNLGFVLRNKLTQKEDAHLWSLYRKT